MGLQTQIYTTVLQAGGRRYIDKNKNETEEVEVAPRLMQDAGIECEAANDDK